jgi:hypothetical protein
MNRWQIRAPASTANGWMYGRPYGLRMGDAMHQISLQSAHAFVNIFQGVGVGEAQITLAVGSEVDAWSDGDPGVFEDVEGQGLGVATETGGIGKDIKRARRIMGHAETDVAEPGQDHPATLIVALDHALHVRPCLLQGGDPGALHEGAGGDEEILLELLHRPHQARGGDDVA